MCPGRVTSMRVPCSMRLVRAIVPPCASIIALQIASPSPVPPLTRARPGSTRKNRSKTRPGQRWIPWPVRTPKLHLGLGDRQPTVTVPERGVWASALSIRLTNTWISKSSSASSGAGSVSARRSMPASSATGVYCSRISATVLARSNDRRSAISRARIGPRQCQERPDQPRHRCRSPSSPCSASRYAAAERAVPRRCRPPCASN